MRVLLAAAMVCLAGCESPTDLHREPTNLSGVPQFFQLRHWAVNAGTQSLVVEGWGTWGVTYTASRDVTAETIWFSSNPAVARVVGQGRIQSVSPGEATITATFTSFTVTQAVRVFPGEAPTRVMTSATLTVRDSSISCCVNGLSGVTVEILTGHNGDRSAVTTTKGQFTFTGPFYCGESMIRLSKAGYREVIRPYTWCYELPQPHLEMAPGGN